MRDIRLWGGSWRDVERGGAGGPGRGRRKGQAERVEKRDGLYCIYVSRVRIQIYTLYIGSIIILMTEQNICNS